jgi:hypothetical protein
MQRPFLGIERGIDQGFAYRSKGLPVGCRQFSGSRANP